MFCENCGTAFRSGAKFCGSCGTKVGGASAARPEPKTIDLAPSPLGLATCDLSIDDVTAETDSDGDVSLNVKYTVTNNTSEDWEYMAVRAQVLRADGVPLEETRDTQEQTIAAGESNEFEAYLRFNSKTLGAASRTATVLMSVTACGAVIEALDQFDVPAQPFEMVELKPVRLGNHLQLISGSLWKREPDGDGDTGVELKALVQSLTAQHLPAVTLLAKINDKALREITDATVTEEVRPGEICVLSGSGYTKDKRLKDAKVALTMRAYYPLAIGHCQSAEVEIPDAAAEDGASDDQSDDEWAGRPVIRALFCYARMGQHILFNAVGLTDSSRGYPLQHYGLICLGKPVVTWRFEESIMEPNIRSSVGAKAQSSGDSGFDFEELRIQGNDKPPSSKELEELQDVVTNKTEEYYFIADTKRGEYRLYEDKFSLIDSDNSWIEPGFMPSVYRVASSVLATADGWALDDDIKNFDDFLSAAAEIPEGKVFTMIFVA